MGDIWNAFVTGMASVIKFFAETSGGHTAIGIVLFTVTVRLLMLPLTLKAVRSGRAMQRLQPLIKEINKKYEPKKGERLSQEKTQAKQAEIMKLYSEYNINPAGSCLPILIQLPLFFAVYSAVRGVVGDPDPLIQNLNTAWSHLSGAQILSGDPFPFFWLKSLTLPDPLYILPVLMVVFQFMTQKMAIPRGGGADEQQRRMNSIMQWTPLIFGFTALNFPTGPVIYWVTTSVFSTIQQFFITGWGSLGDLPGLGFLPVKEIKKVELKKRETIAGQPQRKTWMERMQERQEQITGKPAPAAVAEDDKGTEVVLDKNGNEISKVSPKKSAAARAESAPPPAQPKRTSARISANGAKTASADASADSDLEWGADEAEDDAHDSSSRHDFDDKPAVNNYNQLNRPPKRPSGSNSNGSNGNHKKK